MNAMPRDRLKGVPLDRRTPGTSLPPEAYRAGRAVGRAKVAYGGEEGRWASDGRTLDRLLASLRSGVLITGHSAAHGHVDA